MDFICTANFDRDQKTALMIPAKKAFGEVDKWDDKVLGSLCNVLEALPVRDILKLTSDVVGTHYYFVYWNASNYFLLLC